MRADEISPDRVAAALRSRAKRARTRAKAVQAALAATSPKADPAATPKPARLPGLVEQFSKDRITGWVAVREDSPPTRVSLMLNDLEVAATWASPLADRSNWGEVRGFNIRVKDIWQYAHLDDQLTVRVAGRSLPIAGKGMYLSPEVNGGKRIAVLREKLSHGHVFSQVGRLQLSKKHDVKWQNRVMGLYDDVRDLVTKSLGYDTFLIYGTLLGAVRENGFIGHDIDFDSAYVSAQTDPQAAARELQQIAFALVDAGYDVQCLRTALHIHDGSDPDTRIDLFHLYFDETDTLQFPFGIAGTTTITKAQWHGTEEIDFVGRPALVPKNAKQVVEHIYGAAWQKPTPGFDWDRDRTTRDWRGVLPKEWGEEVYWANFYAHTEYTTGSTFFELVNARPDMPNTVIDIGCGDGRDSYAFGLAGRTVLGVDRAEIGVAHATKKAESMGMADRVRFAACDVSDAAALRAALSDALAASPAEPVLFYLRFFLHSIPEDVQEVLLGVIDECARPGDLFAAEFRTDKDEKIKKVHTKHYRRFQNGPEFGVTLSDKHGFDLLDEQQGTGLSPYKDEDPELYRVIGVRRA
jgi:hypothetical protein